MLNKMPKINRYEEIKAQFDALAADLDAIKRKNLYYFNNLKKIFKDRITKESPKIIEIGCAQGEILGWLAPKVGVGMDISPEMIKIAKTKYPQYSFYCRRLEDINIKDKFDYVILPDVLEYTSDLNKAFGNLKALCKKSTKVIITSPNPLWSFILAIAGKLNLKMTDRLSRKYSKKEIKLAAEKQGFKTIECSTRLLIPKKVLFSDYINKEFYRFPVLKELGVTQVLVLKVE